MLDPGHPRSDAQTSCAGVNDLARDHVSDDLQKGAVPRNPLPPTNDESLPDGDASAATNSDPGQCPTDAPRASAGADLHDATLVVLADALDDLERVRIATEGRIRSLRQLKGLEGTKFEASLTDLQVGLGALEHKAELDLKRAMRQHPLYGFVKQTRGLGEKQAARLLAAIGDPAERPNPAKLLQYCGHGDPERSRKRRGERAQFNPTAKMRAHLCAESMLRAGNRATYDAARASWADHDTTDGHKHNHALRLVAKDLLRDLWKYARALPQTISAAQTSAGEGSA